MTYEKLSKKELIAIIKNQQEIILEMSGQKYTYVAPSLPEDNTWKKPWNPPYVITCTSSHDWLSVDNQ